MRRSRLAAARAGHVRKRGQPHGRQRNVGSPRGPHLMVSTSMVYGCIIDVFNTENISAECIQRENPSGPFALGLRGLGLKGLKCASRPMRSAARASCVLRSVPKSKPMAGPAMSGLRRITGWGNNGALRAFGKGFVLRSAFRGKPVGSLRPRSSGIGAEGDKVRFARFGWGLSRRRVWCFSPYDCCGRGPVWDRGRFVVGQI